MKTNISEKLKEIFEIILKLSEIEEIFKDGDETKIINSKYKIFEVNSNIGRIALQYSPKEQDFFLNGQKLEKPINRLNLNYSKVEDLALVANTLLEEMFNIYSVEKENIKFFSD